MRELLAGLIKVHSFLSSILLNVCQCEKNLSRVLGIVSLLFKTIPFLSFFLPLFNGKRKYSLEIVRYYQCSHVFLH